jgi:hypothetical protein
MESALVIETGNCEEELRRIVMRKTQVQPHYRLAYLKGEEEFQISSMAAIAYKLDGKAWRNAGFSRVIGMVCAWLANLDLASTYYLPQGFKVIAERKTIEDIRIVVLTITPSCV